MAEQDRQFRCLNCGHIHDEAAGSPGDGIAPGTRWEDLPDNWICPQCGSDKRDFEQL